MTESDQHSYDSSGSSTPPGPPSVTSSDKGEPEENPDNKVTIEEMREATKEFDDDFRRRINLNQKGLPIDD